jgi:hypothetical protein
MNEVLMLKPSIYVIIAALALSIASSAFIHSAYSQNATMNSSKINGTLEIGGGAGMNATSNMIVPDSSQTANTPSETKYEAAREQFLKVWDTLEFEPRDVTFVNESATIGNGQYQEHSNVFAPGESMVLYVQPIGFGHKQIQGENGQKLFLMNFTADIIISMKNGTLVGGGRDISLSQPISHYRNTELFITLTVTQTNPFPAGDYVIKYTVTDQIKGKSFDITKDVKVV